MKKLSFLISVFLFLYFAFPTSLAAASSADLDYIDEFRNIVPDGNIYDDDSKDLISAVGFDALMSEILTALRGGVGKLASFLMLLLGLSVMFAFAELSETLFDVRLSSAVMAGTSGVSALVLGGAILPLVQQSAESLRTVSGFFSSLIPIVTGISASSGANVTAGVQALNMNITLSLLGTVLADLLLPFVFAMFAFSLVGSLGGNSFSAVSKLLRSSFMWILGICQFVLLTAVSLQSFIASSADGAAARAVKYAVSGSIPIVGSTVSGALSTLSGALSYASTVVGIGSVAVIISICLSPIILLLLYRFSFSAAIAFLGFLGAEKSGACLASFRSALDSLTAVYVMSTLVYILEIVVFMKSGVGFIG